MSAVPQPPLPDTQLFHDTFNASPVGVVVEDLAGQLLFVNPAFCSMLGFTEEELRRKHCVEFSPAEDAEKDWALFQQLQSESIDHYQLEKRYFRHDGTLLWGRLSISLLHTGSSPLVIAMVEDITEKRSAEEAVHSQEELLESFVRNVPAGVAILDRDMRYLQVSDRWCADYSLDSSQVIGRSHYELFLDVPEQWKEMHRRGLSGETLRCEEDRWQREDGTIKWVRWEIRPWTAPSGAIRGILIFAEDITQGKQLEIAISEMSQRLIESQEQERTRIARELHDDIGQRLALLTGELYQLTQGHPDLHAEVRARLRELQKQTTGIAVDIQSLSHELHSAKLEYLGLVVAMKSFCREFGEQQAVAVDFESQDLPISVPPDISLCLFRVLQEALHNSAKHSGARTIEVDFRVTSADLQLTVRDAGMGFDGEAAKQSRGLGLISMQERVKAVKGRFSVESQPGGGTTIRACVPLDSPK
jgi:PAS domain S-box-containing protein